MKSEYDTVCIYQSPGPNTNTSVPIGFLYFRGHL